jgi:hypothetical protein
MSRQKLKAQSLKLKAQSLKLSLLRKVKKEDLTPSHQNTNLPCLLGA